MDNRREIYFTLLQFPREISNNLFIVSIVKVGIKTSVLFSTFFLAYFLIGGEISLNSENYLGLAEKRQSVEQNLFMGTADPSPSCLLRLQNK